MQRYLIIALYLCAFGASGLTLDPMHLDKVVRTSDVKIHYRVRNDGLVAKDYEMRVFEYETGDLVHTEKAIIGGKMTTTIAAKVFLPQNKVVRYKVCVRETSKGYNLVALQACAKLRLYWAASLSMQR